MEIRISNTFREDAIWGVVFSREVKIDGENSNLANAGKAARGGFPVCITDGNYTSGNLEKCATIKNGALLNALKRAFPFTCKPGKDHWAHKSACGVCLDFSDGDAFCVGANMYMMAKIRIGAKYAEPFRITVPNDFAKMLMTVLQKNADGECTVSTNGELVRIAGGGFDATYSLKDGYMRYPNYARVFPKTAERTCTFDVKEMKEVIDKITADARSTGSAPVFEAVFSDYSVLCIYENREVESVKPLVMSFTMPATSTSGDFVVDFDAKLLRTVLSSVKAKKCTIGFNRPMQAVTFAPHGDYDSSFLLMPHYPKYGEWEQWH